ncbi:hypothetical protein [Pseudomonas helleri]|uniref:hypothetical protein n=1 Tax=Pseudomonas helleri TaxID=1608996 RepID=UPI003F951FFC
MTEAQKTPAAKWRQEGQADPHGNHYNCQRAALPLGELTDDELANGVFLHGNEPLNINALLRKTPGYHSAAVWLNAGKDRIRWLSRALEESAAREQALQQRLNAADQRIDDCSGTCEWSREDDSGIWHSGCGVTWSFHDDGPEENGMHFCHSCGKTLVVEATTSEPEQDDDWHMNPCKQGHRDVGASGGVAHCYTCGEEITATTTQEAFEQWNATHAAVDAAPEAKP